jgi:hypothetical protein
MSKFDVAIIGTTGSLGPVSRDVCLWPQVGHPKRTWFRYRHCLAPPQRFLGGFRQFDFDDFTGNNTGAKNNSAVDTADS